jgi:hypothetical protein
MTMYDSITAYVAGVLRCGVERAHAEAESIIIAVRRAMGMVYDT